MGRGASQRLPAGRLASLATNIQITPSDPALIVLGGGVGLGRGYLDRVLCALADVDQRFRPDRPATLGARAGIAGVADLAAGGGRIQGGEDVCERFFSH